MSTTMHRSRRTPYRVAGGYLIFGVLWILLSDYLVEIAGLVGAQAAQVQSMKGIAFVLLSSCLVFWLSLREVSGVTRAAALLEAVTEGTSDAVFVKDREGRYLMCNPAGAAFVNRTPEQVVGRTDFDLFNPESAALLQARDRAVIESGKVCTETEEVSFNGAPLAFMATKAPYRNERGEVAGVVGVSRDITRQVQAEKALRVSEERFRTLVEHASDGIFIIDDAGNFVEVNSAAWQMVGCSREELLNMSMADVVTPEEAPRVAPGIAQLRAGVALRSEWKLRRRDGTLFHGDVSARRLPDGRLLGTVRDITERKRSEQALEQTRITLATFIENTPAAIAMLDRNLCYLAVSRRWLQDYRLGDRDLHGQHHYDVFPEIRNMPHWQAIHQRCLAGETIRCEEDHFVRPDGAEQWLRWEVRPWHDERGEIGGMIMYTEEITQRVRATMALRESERRFRTIVETTSEWIWSTDVEGRHTMSNPAIARVLGYEASEIVGRPAADLMHPEDREKVGKWLPDCIAQKRGWTGVVIRWRCKNGQYRWLESNASPILDDAGHLVGFFGADRDITERKKTEEALKVAEEQLRQSQKMEAVGQLAGGIAHDFNNLLTVITGYSEMLASMPANEAHRLGLVQGIADAGRRATALTRQLLAFSRRQILDPRVIDLNRAVTEIESMLRRMIGAGIRLETSLASDLSPVRVDPGQIDQVIMNLAINSRDAMPNGGTLTIETREVELDSAFVAGHPDAQPGRYVMLAVRDTGEGIHPDIRHRLFEPFFTTKEPGKGTGLGLPVVHGIVKQSGGCIDVQSAPGAGACFFIYLPVVRGQSAAAAPTESDRPTTGTETILLVEDNQAVREFASLALESRGYRVLKAASSSEAINIMDHRGDAVDLLLTDIVMPQMSGRSLAQILRARRPALRTLFVSGYTEEEAVNGAFPASESFLQKPFTATSLGNKVREVLDQPAPQPARV